MEPNDISEDLENTEQPKPAQETTDETIDQPAISLMDEKIKGINTILADATTKQGEIGGFLTNSSTKSGEIDTLHTNSTTKSGEIDTLHTNSTTKSGEIDTLHTNSTTKSGEIDTLHTNSTTKSGEINAFHTNSTTKSGEIDTLHTNSSTKSDEIDALHTNSTTKSGEIDTLHTNSTTKSGEIDTLHTNSTTKSGEINAFHTNSTTKSGEIDTLHTNSSTKSDEISQFHTDSYTHKNEIAIYHKTLLSDEETEPSIKSQINKAKLDINKVYTESSDKIDALKAFYKSVFENTVNDKGEEVEGLQSAVISLKNRLDNLIKNADLKLNALTDSSLHNSFASRAAEHTTDYSKYQKYTLYGILSIIGVTILFGTIQLVRIYTYNSTFNYQLLIYQLGITTPVIFVVWMYNRNQKIAKKLAEEYHHKSALSEAMTGYRSLYQLKHDSDEYMSLFNEIKKQLNVNPSTKIDKFLNLKSPHEQVIDNFANPEALAKLADSIKPFLTETKVDKERS